MEEIVKIERMGYGADAIAHLSDGKTAFVPGAVPGDITNIEVIEDKRNFARCRMLEIVEASPSRVSRPQGLPSSIAPWGDMDYACQLDSKESNVRSALERTARLGPDEIDSVFNPIVASPQTDGYRNKVEMSAERSVSGRLELGFRNATDGFVPFFGKRLDIAEPLIQELPRKIAGALGYVLKDGSDGLHRVGIRGSSATGSIEVAMWTSPGPFPRAFASKLIEEATGATSIVRVIAPRGSARKVKRVERLSGAGHWSEKLALGDGGTPKRRNSFTFDVSAPSFFQVNTFQATAILKKVLALIEGHFSSLDGLRIADLYSGVGMFSLPLASRGADVTAIELAGSSVRDLERNARNASVEIDIICDDVERSFPAFGADGDFDAIVVDPPRSGLTAKALQGIAEAEPRLIVYLSCDPQTLARDIARFRECGYSASFVQPFDMFPQTWHVETLSVLNPVI